MTTPNAAPPEMPSTEGSASGLRVSAWNATPATASAPPPSMATAIRGSLTPSVTTRSTESVAARPVTARTTASGARCALPTKGETAATTARQPRSTATVRMSLQAGFAPSTAASATLAYPTAASLNGRPGGPEMAPRPPTLGRAPAQPWPASGLPWPVSPKRLGMDRARQLLQAVDDSRSVPVEQIAVDDLDAGRASAGERRESFPFLARRHSRTGPVARQHDDLGMAGDRALETESRIAAAIASADTVAPRELDQL